MHSHIHKYFAALILSLIMLTAGTTWAQDIKTRMRDRLPTLVDLKTRGVIGENNQGYLDMLKGQTEKKEVVAAENQDRRTIYAEIARKTSTTIEVVGQRRAIQIAEKASAGDWLQDASGAWYQKK
jgi:uncharacterized protein